MITDKMKQVLESYNKGLESYKSRSFEDAKNFFAKALEADPGDGPSKVYFTRCEDYIENPPPADWDGVYTMTTK